MPDTEKVSLSCLRAGLRPGGDSGTRTATAYPGRSASAHIGGDRSAACRVITDNTVYCYASGCRV